MGIQWLLLIACVSCVHQGWCAESLKEQSLEVSDDSASFLMSSLFGFRPCLDEGCSDISSQRAGYPVEEGSALPSHPAPEYEPQYPEVVSPDAVVEHCLPLHVSTLHEISIIEMRHPDIKEVKSKVIEDLVRYVTQFSALYAENCDPAMKLLDFILLAAEALKQEYVSEIGNTCGYTDIFDDGRSTGYPDQSQDKTELTTTQSVYSTSLTPDYVSTEASSKLPCPEGSSEPSAATTPVEPTERPCPERPSEQIEPEVIAEDDGHVYPSPPFVGSVRGIPGVHYPNYTDVPLTSFSCADKKYIPGFYADLETGCQVFHVCYEHRRESFLCPVGTIFNQPILACDYWYSSNCSLAADCYEINAEEVTEEEEINAAVGDLITVLVEGKKEAAHETVPEESVSETDVDITQFLPVKAKVTEFTKPEIKEIEATPTQSLEVDEVASQIFKKMVSSTAHVLSKSKYLLGKIPEPELLYGVKAKLAKGKMAAAAVQIATGAAMKAKLVAAVVPVAKITATKVVPFAVKAKLSTYPVAKAAVPVVSKAKLVASVPKVAVKAKLSTFPVAKAAVPVVSKAKLVASVPKIAVKASVPVLKAKMIASALPLAKTKIVAPVLKGKALKSGSAPFVKAKVVALPLVKSALAGSTPVVKTKLGAVAAISPLTKKALALGYMKLLKAKKLALMG